MISSLSSQIKKCRSLKDCTAVIRGLEANAPRSDRIFADDAPMPNTYCPMTVLTKKQLFLKLCWSTDTCGHNIYEVKRDNIICVLRGRNKPVWHRMTILMFGYRLNILVIHTCANMLHKQLHLNPAVGNIFNTFQPQPGIGVD